MTKDELLSIVCDVVRAHAAGATITVEAGTPLGPDGLGIDSIGCLEIVLELEHRTGIALRDENLSAETLATPGSLSEHLLASQRSQHG